MTTTTSPKKIYVIGDFNAHFSIPDDKHKNAGYGSSLYNWYYSNNIHVDVLRTTAYFKTSVPSLYIPTVHPKRLNQPKPEQKQEQVEIINSTSIKNNIDSFLANTQNDDILFFILHIGMTDAKKSYPVIPNTSIYFAKNPFSVFVDGNTYVEPSDYQSNMEYIIQQLITTHPNTKIFLISPQSNTDLYSSIEYSDIAKNVQSIYSSHVILIDSTSFITNDDFNLNSSIINNDGHHKIFKEIQNVIKSSHVDMKPMTLLTQRQRQHS
jgi:hypothetical protein